MGGVGSDGFQINQTTFCAEDASSFLHSDQHKTAAALPQSLFRCQLPRSGGDKLRFPSAPLAAEFHFIPAPLPLLSCRHASSKGQARGKKLSRGKLAHSAETIMELLQSHGAGGTVGLTPGHDFAAVDTVLGLLHRAPIQYHSVVLYRVVSCIGSRLSSRGFFSLIPLFLCRTLPLLCLLFLHLRHCLSLLALCLKNTNIPQSQSHISPTTAAGGEGGEGGTGLAMN